jgi:hypothetical protein
VLTKDLLLYRIRSGAITPSFVSPANPELLAFCEPLLAMAAAGVGSERGVLEDQVHERGIGGLPPKVAAGLVKLLFDRMTFEEPSPEANELRRTSFDTSTRILRELPDGSSVAEFEAALAAALPRPIEEVREKLYADHPENRRMLSWEPLEAKELLERYNMAQVQGLILRAQRVSIRATAPDLLRVRKLLRWLKFCRLVPEMQAIQPDLVMEVEGPAAILSMEKKYGLQLAQFVAMVPVLEHYEIRAEIDFDRRPTAMLTLDERSGLVASDRKALGYVPEEITVILKKLEDGPWVIDPNPVPRSVGAAGHCVPDIAFRKGKKTVAIEFFHLWHRHALARRLADLKTRPDTSLVLAVEEKLLKDETLAGAADHPQVMTFHGFPSERGIRKLLEARLGG